MKTNIFMTVILLTLTIPTACAETPEKTVASNMLTSAGFQIPARSVKAPDFSLATLDGNTVKLSDFKGRIVLLNFWATWCPPCRAEMPSMEKAYRELKAAGLEILAVDLQEDVKTVKNYITGNGFTFPVLLDTTGKTGATYGARSIPTTYLIDRNGTILGMTVGGREWTDANTLKLLRYVTGNER